MFFNFKKATSQAPIFSVSLFLVLVLLHAVPTVFERFHFDRYLVFELHEWWRLLSSQLVHLDARHLIMNAATLLLLGYFFETEYHKKPFVPILLGAFFVAIQLPFSELDKFCGISGALNALILPVAWVLWKKNGSYLVWLFVALHVFRLFFELFLGAPLVANLEWPSYPPSHLLGGFAGALWLALNEWKGKARY